MTMRHSRLLVSGLLCGLVIALAIGALTKRNGPVLIWLIVIGVGLIVGISQEWFAVIRRPSANKSGTSTVILGSIPYLAGILPLAAFVYFLARLLFGQTMGYGSVVLGQVAILSISGVFLGGVVMYLIALAKRRIKRREK